MAGYSGTPLPKKLGIKEHSRVSFIDAPPEFDDMLGELPREVEILPSSAGNLDVVVCFVTETRQLEARFLELKPLLAWSGGLWLAWPKKTSGIPTSLVENTIREIGLAAGLVDNKVCAIDERWSGLRFVWRVADRPKSGKVKAAAR
ncbi:MAG: DUF3052 domain-containing protein [Dehalococcoidia bacterium]